jgi:hypothetical protein
MKLKITFLLILTTLTVFSQEENKPKGVVIGKVFFNYHIDTTKDAVQSSAFELTRTYLGYKYNFSDKLSATLLFDSGKGSGNSDFSLFVKNAKLDYKADSWLTLSVGLFGLKQFKDQEKFWGYRYLYKSFNDKYKFGSSADAGVMAAMKISDKLKIDVLIVNGEGYKKLQDASGYTRLGTNLVYTPSKSWIFKAYYDTMKGKDADNITTVSNIALFAGYKLNDKFRIGAEYNIIQNGITYKNVAKGKNQKGLSFYSTYNINKKWNVFGRYDQISSNRLSNQINNWNYTKDGNTIIAGFEFKPTDKINTSINYRLTNFEDATNNNTSLIYFNLEFAF